MPSVSNHFSVKIPTVLAPNPPLSSLPTPHPSHSLCPTIPDCLAFSLPCFSSGGRGGAQSLMICSYRCPSNSHQRGQRQLTIVRRGTVRTAADSNKPPVRSKRTPELPNHLFNTQSSEQTRCGLRWTCKSLLCRFSLMPRNETSWPNVQTATLQVSNAKKNVLAFLCCCSS